MYLSADDPGADLLTSIGEDRPADPLRVEPLQVLRVVWRLAGMDSTYHEKCQEMRRVHIFFSGGVLVDARRGWCPDPAAQCLWPKPVPRIGTFISTHPTSQMFQYLQP